jgi:phage-related protein
MPRTLVVFFKDEDGSVPILDWLDGLEPKAQVKCLAKLKRLEELGHELRRPEADLLRDGVHELRIGLRGVNYRVLYFIHGQVAAVVSHGLTKERVVPPAEIDRAVRRKQAFEKDPGRWTFEPEG